MPKPRAIVVRHDVLGDWHFHSDGITPQAKLVRPAEGWPRDLSQRPGAATALSGWSPLGRDRSVPSDATLLSYAVEADDVDLVEGLLSAGADPNVGAVGERSGGALLSRARSGAVASALVSFGADLAPSAGDGSTPLHGARHPDVVRLLLEAGCDPLLPNRHGVTPLALADSAMVPRETYHLLRNAAVSRARALPGRGVVFQGRRKAARDHGAAFAQRRLRASAELHWTVIAAPGQLDTVTQAMATVLAAPAIERDVAERSVVARDGVFVFRPVGSGIVIAFLDPDDPRSGVARRQRNLKHAMDLSRVLGHPVFIVRDMCMDEVMGDDVTRIGANDDRDPGYESKADGQIAADFDGACTSRGIQLPDVTVEGDGLRHFLRVRGWTSAELGPAHFIVTIP